MRFYGKGAIIDGRTGRVIGRFNQGGIFETENPALIKRLRRRFQSDDSEMTKAQLIELAREQGLEVDSRMKKADIIALLNQGDDS